MSETYSTGAIPSQNVMAVWAVLSQLYPSAFKSVDQRDPAGVWSANLDDLSDNAMRAGLIALRRCTDRYMPNAAYCRKIILDEVRSSPPRSAAPQIEAPRAPLTKKERARRACKGALAMRLCGQSPSESHSPDIDAPWLASCVEVDLDHRATLVHDTEACRAYDAGVFARLDQLFEEEWQ